MLENKDRKWRYFWQPMILKDGNYGDNIMHTSDILLYLS